MHNWKKIIGGFLVTSMFVLYGCGEGGEGGTTQQSMISGTASQGTALAAGSTVYLKDAKGVEKTTSVVGDNGSYTMAIDGLTAPYVLKAGNYYSFTTAPGTVNINPFTHLCIVDTLGTTDVAAFYGYTANPLSAESLNALVTKYKLIVDDLKTQIDALYASSVPVSQRDFLNGTIVISQGVDKIFENIDIVSNSSGFTINSQAQSSILVSGARDLATGTVTLSRNDNAIASLSSILYPKVSTIQVVPTSSSTYSILADNMDGVAGIQLDIAYDAASLATPTVTQGGLVSGAMLAANTTQPGIIKIAIISTRTFSGSGQIAAISFASKTGSGSITLVKTSLIDSKGSPLASSASTPLTEIAAQGNISTPGVPFSQAATTTN